MKPFSGVGSGDLEDRLNVLAAMLDEAIALLRSTMAEVTRENDEGGFGDPDPDERR